MYKQKKKKNGRANRRGMKSLLNWPKVRLNSSVRQFILPPTHVTRPSSLVVPIKPPIMMMMMCWRQRCAREEWFIRKQSKYPSLSFPSRDHSTILCIDFFILLFLRGQSLEMEEKKCRACGARETCRGKAYFYSFLSCLSRNDHQEKGREWMLSQNPSFWSFWVSVLVSGDLFHFKSRTETVQKTNVTNNYCWRSIVFPANNPGALSILPETMHLISSAFVQRTSGGNIRWTWQQEQSNKYLSARNNYWVYQRQRKEGKQIKSLFLLLKQKPPEFYLSTYLLN